MKVSAKWKIAQRLELRWWKHYLRKKDVHEYLDWKRDYWQRFIQPLGSDIDLSTPKKILDAGCGPAGIFTILGQHSVTAIDPLLDRYETSLPHFSRSAYPDVVFIETPLEMYQEATRFDLIFCLNAINHVSDIYAGLKVLLEHMDTSGQLILSIDCHRYKFLRALFRWIPGDALHPHQDSLEDYRSMISSLGGEIVLEHKEKPGRIFDYYVLVIRKEN